MKNTLIIILRKAVTLVPIFLLISSIVVVRKLLLEYTLEELIIDLRSISAIHIFIASILTMLNYVVLTLYDYLGTRYVRAAVPVQRVALVSFIAYSFSQNLGVSVLSGGAIRYRFYSKEGISTPDIARIIAFAGFHFWLGLFFLTGVLSLLFPDVYAETFHMQTYVFKIIGVSLLLPSMFYMLLVFFPHIANKRIQKHLPSRLLGISGILVCVVDWILASSVFYVMLHGEHEITLLKTIISFTGAQSLGVISHVPGGLGVFEATAAYLLSPHHDNSRLISSLIAFRLMYYILPFVLSSIILLASELLVYVNSLKKMTTVSPLLRTFASICISLFPLINSYLTVATGVLLSFSINLFGADILIIGEQVPFYGFMHESFIALASILALMLCLVGIGIRRRNIQSWNIALSILSLLLCVSIIGLNTYRTVLILINICILLLSKKTFTRSGSFFKSFERASIFWIFGLIIIIFTYGLFVFQMDGAVRDAWWLYEVDSSYSRFMRTILATAIFYSLFSLYVICLKTEQHAFTPPMPEDYARISSIMKSQNATHGNLCFAGDKEILYSDERDAFLMWRESGISFIALGDPIGDEAQVSSLLWKFREISNSYSRVCVLYEISADTIPLAMDIGLKVFKIGEEGIVNLHTFTLQGPQSSQFRNVINRMHKEEAVFRVIEAEEIAKRMSELKAVSDDWLAHKHSSEKSFSLGAFDERYLLQFRLGIVEQRGKIVAFTNLMESGTKKELSIDLMRHIKVSPNGIMDYLFVNLFEWGRENGFDFFNLGMAPLSGLSRNALSPSYAKLGNLIYYHGSHFYNFDGLRKYKNKFNPVWRPKYLACSSSYLLPVILSNISLLISGGIKKLISK